jgi:demethylmenaquinone methyltransferase/2-methoxy-6-polyprenyl-1,4-benzoquinol methylase
VRVAVREAERLPSGQARERFVKRLFAAIAPTYDLMNVVMSAGCIYYWHRVFGRHTGLVPGDTALDVCTGTGDLARVLSGQVGPEGKVVGLDFSPEMLAIARRKFEGSASYRNIVLVEGNALELPYPDASFGAASMGFALRNVSDLPRAIREMARVVRPGGRVLTLELSKPPSRLVRVPYFFYFYRIVPILGRVVNRRAGRTGSIRPYTYLPASLVKFPDQQAVARLFEEAGLTDVTYYGLNGGIVTLHVGTKPA